MITLEILMTGLREIKAQTPFTHYVLPIHPKVLKRPEWPEMARAMIREEPGCIIDANGRTLTEEDVA